MQPGPLVNAPHVAANALSIAAKTLAVCLLKLAPLARCWCDVDRASNTAQELFDVPSHEG